MTRLQPRSSRAASPANRWLHRCDGERTTFFIRLPLNLDDLAVGETAFDAA